MAETMRAVVYHGVGGPEVVRVGDVPVPEPGPTELLVQVHAAGLNRGDILQRDGEYDVPAGQSAIPGVEIAGLVVARGSHAHGFAPGDRVFGVVEGGGFAEYCRLDCGMANAIPPQWTMTRAAAAAEAWLTADETLFVLGGLARGKSVLIWAAASGIGTAAVLMAKHVGAVVYGTTGTRDKADAVARLGADAVVNHRETDVVAAVRRLSRGAGVDVVLDFVGGARLSDNLAVLRDGGCLVVAGLLDGLTARVDLLDVVARRLQIKGSSLRLRPMDDKRQVNARFQARWLPLLGGQLAPVIHREYGLDDIRAAQREMEDNHAIGKIVLRVRRTPGTTP